jgi:hypothetical protein
MKADQKGRCVLLPFSFFASEIYTWSIYTRIWTELLKHQTYLQPLYNRSLCKARYLMVDRHLCLPSRTLLYANTRRTVTKAIGGKKDFKIRRPQWSIARRLTCGCFKIVLRLKSSYYETEGLLFWLFFCIQFCKRHNYLMYLLRIFCTQSIIIRTFNLCRYILLEWRELFSSLQ